MRGLRYFTTTAEKSRIFFTFLCLSVAFLLFDVLKGLAQEIEINRKERVRNSEGGTQRPVLREGSWA
jgi:hypothetical protein